MMITPTIINIEEDFMINFDFVNKPSLIIVIENKRITEEEIKNANIDYTNKNTKSEENIANYFNKRHADLIESEFINRQDYFLGKTIPINKNFAYHYLIDRCGNIYSGRSKKTPCFNLDMYDITENGDYELIPQLSNIFSSFIVIMMEESSNDKMIKNEAYAALSNLIRYLKKKENIKEYYMFSEIKNFEIEPTENKEDFNLNKLNPGIFFKTNELRSKIDVNILNKKNTSEFNVITYTYGTRVLKYSKNKALTGNDVIQLQYLLHKDGIISDFKNVNGIYNYITSKSVEEYQRLNYIIPTEGYGIADFNTQKHLMNKVLKLNESNTDSNFKPFRVLEVRDDLMIGDDVKLLQLLIKEKITSSQPINGIYDKITAEHIKYYQKYLNLEIIDGKCSPFVFSMLKHSYLKVAQNDIIEKNEFATCEIVLLNKALNNFNKNSEITELGIYGELTQKSIKSILINENNIEVINNEFELKYNDTTHPLLGLDENVEYDFINCPLKLYDYLVRNFFYNY